MLVQFPIPVVVRMVQVVSALNAAARVMDGEYHQEQGNEFNRDYHHHDSQERPQHSHGPMYDVYYVNSFHKN